MDIYKCYKEAFGKYFPEYILSEDRFENQIWENSWPKAVARMGLQRKMATQIHRYKDELYNQIK